MTVAFFFVANPGYRRNEATRRRWLNFSAGSDTRVDKGLLFGDNKLASVVLCWRLTCAGQGVRPRNALWNLKSGLMVGKGWIREEWDDGLEGSQ